jgi:hypothetical protein
MDNSQGIIRIPIETNIEFQRAFSASFDRLPTGTQIGDRSREPDQMSNPRNLHLKR